MIGRLANGNLLIGRIPGLTKTRTVKAMANGLGAKFGRIQFTPVLRPPDVTGTEAYHTTDSHAEFRFEPDPIFAKIVLADEIHRAPAKVQAALLEAMDKCGRTHAWTAGRNCLDPTVIHAAAPDVFRHRLTLSSGAKGEGTAPDQVTARLVAPVALP